MLGVLQLCSAIHLAYTKFKVCLNHTWNSIETLGHLRNSLFVTRFYLKTAFITLLKLLAGLYFVLTSIYCLLAYLPYTYADLILTPPNTWMPWFAHWHTVLYWLFLFVMASTSWENRWRLWYHFAFGGLALFGVFITVK